jgi:hypothetical protein
MDEKWYMSLLICISHKSHFYFLFYDLFISLYFLLFWWSFIISLLGEKKFIDPLSVREINSWYICLLLVCLLLIIAFAEKKVIVFYTVDFYQFLNSNLMIPFCFCCYFNYFISLHLSLCYMEFVLIYVWWMVPAFILPDD